MTRYVALLGGINVGGHRCTMDELRAAFSGLGFDDVATFIASGNVLFTSGDAPEVGRIEAALERRLGYAVPTFVRTADQVVALPAACPFEGGSIYVCFLDEEPPAEVSAAVEALRTEVDTMRVIGTELWWRVEGKLLDSTLHPKAFARAGIRRLTNRNLTTVQRLCEKLSR